VLNPHATPLLSRRIAAADSLQEQLFAMVVLGDDRLVERVVVNGNKHLCMNHIANNV
jgi:guanine deaminase